MNAIGTNQSNIATGGKTVYGASVGILMLETRFPRIPGDIGNALTWPFPVQYKIVRGASPNLVVRHRAEGLLDPFLEAARDLVDLGVDGITTNCGFLSLFQNELAGAVNVPIATSSLMQIPLVERLLPPGKRAGILTISAQTLSEDHLAAAGVPLDTPVVGTESGQEFSRAILEDEFELDLDLSRSDLLHAGEELVNNHDNIGAIVLECTNMVPYARLLQQRFNMPVYSIYSFVTWFQSGLTPRSFD